MFTISIKKMENLSNAENYVLVTVCNEDGHPFKDLYIFENEEDCAHFEREYIERNDICFDDDQSLWNQKEILITPNRADWLSANCYRGFMNDIWVLNND